LWYSRVVRDMAALTPALDYYNAELDAAQSETRISGSLEKNAQDLPGHTTHRFTQLQDVESILKHLNVKYDKMRSELYRKYVEHYNRDLTDRAIEKYLDGEQPLYDMHGLIGEVAHVRNGYLGLMKGLETKNWQISNIIKLRIIGLENSQLD